MPRPILDPIKALISYPIALIGLIVYFILLDIQLRRMVRSTEEPNDQTRL